MLDQERLDSLCKELDKFIDEKYKVPPADFNLLRDETQKLNELDNHIKSNLKEKEKRKPLADVLKNKMEMLGLERNELCILTLIPGYYYDKLVGGQKPSKFRLMSLGFALIDKTLEKTATTPPEEIKEIMDELFHADNIDYKIEDDNLFDVIIKFCLENKIYEIIEIDFFLEKKGETDLSERVLEGITQDEKNQENKKHRYYQKKMIEQLLEKMQSRYPKMGKCEYQKGRIDYYIGKYNLTEYGKKQ